jgi:hypothetical protein
MRFIPPTPHVMLMEEDFSNLKVDLPFKIIFTPLLWDIEDMYGTSKGPR